ncbi:MAG TPA: hypothetical protein DGH68_09545 [Bacteroidetes bacterium]|nr:hypothetical protein [Bacteroidota bacterium]
MIGATALRRYRKLFVQLCIGCVLFCLYSSSTPANAQPSGGPYGPIRQTYDLPKVSGKIYYVAADGKSDQSGETLTKPTTLEAAIERVHTGDAIVMRGGTYRTGNLVLNQGITMQPYADEQPVVKGTYVATKWENLGNGLWTTSWSRFFPTKPADWWRRNREGKRTPLHRFNNDMVFVDGKFLQAVGWEGEVDENSYYIDYDAGLVYIGIDPKDRLVEITAFDVALLRTTKECHGKTSDHKGYTIRGITFSQYAYRALEIEGTEPEGLSDESKHGKEVVGTTLEDCTISYCSRVAGYFRGDRMTIRHCRVSDTSTEGVYVIASNDVLLEKNIFTRNNIENITGYYPAAVKIFNQCYRVTCRDNLVIDLPNSNGIWYDVGNVDGVFVNNWIEGVGHNDKAINTDQLWPSDNGFFFEISKGAICAGNVFVNCDHGMMVLNSSNVQICQNTFVNSMACIGRNARSAVGDHFGWHPSTGPDVDKREGHTFINNLLTGNESFSRPLLFVWQPASMCKQLTKSQLTQLDCNVYVRRMEKTSDPLILWSPASNENCQAIFESLESLRKLYPEFSAHCRYYSSYDGPLFKGVELGNYQLLQAFPGSSSGMQLPAEVGKLLGQYKNDVRHVGAYAPVQ